MTIEEARRIEKEFYDNPNPSEDECLIYTEAMEYIIKTTNDTEAMVSLGGYYYGEREFDLALKYYEMAAEYENEGAYECLGYIWYYGRTGTKDYEKAFKYFQLARASGNIVAEYKLADMYKNGYYVEKDYDTYCKIIEGLYLKVKNCKYLHEPLPEIYTRLAKIRVEQEDVTEAIRLYYFAKDFLAQRISYNPFFGDLNIMMWLIDDLYELIEFDSDDFDLYDLYYLLKLPVKVEFYFEGRKQFLEVVDENGEMVIKFNGICYKTREDFFSKATIDDLPLTHIYDALEDFTVV